MPVATRALPSVHRSTSAGMASIFSVGLDNGRTTGRSTWRTMARTTSRVKAPCWVEVPTSTVGCTWSTTPCRSAGPSSGHSSSGRAYGRW